MDDDDWSLRAACKGTPSELFFTEELEDNAKKYCDSCPVSADCLTDQLRWEHSEGFYSNYGQKHAFGRDLIFGVFGGMGPEERFSFVTSRQGLDKRLGEVFNEGIEDPASVLGAARELWRKT